MERMYNQTGAWLSSYSVGLVVGRLKFDSLADQKTLKVCIHSFPD